MLFRSIAGKGMQVTDDDRNFWAYAPLQAVKAPTVQQNNWPANDIDRFVLRKLESAKLQPNGPADPRTQIRRLFFDESPLKSACGLDGRKKHSGDGVFLGDR